MGGVHCPWLQQAPAARSGEASPQVCTLASAGLESDVTVAIESLAWDVQGSAPATQSNNGVFMEGCHDG